MGLYVCVGGGGERRASLCYSGYAIQGKVLMERIVINVYVWTWHLCEGFGLDGMSISTVRQFQ